MSAFTSEAMKELQIALRAIHHVKWRPWRWLSPQNLLRFLHELDESFQIQR